MSTRTESFGPALVAAGGVALLAARLPLLSLPAGTRVAAFAALVAGVGTASWLAPARGAEGRLPRLVVLAIGLAAVSLTAAVSGRPRGSH